MRSLVVASVEAWGVSGVSALIFASAVVSAPMMVMAATAVRYGHLGALPFVALGLLPAYSGRPNLNCIEFTWWLTAGLLSVSATVVNWLSGGSDETFAFLTLAAMVPAPTYLLAGAARAYLIFSLIPEICATKLCTTGCYSATKSW